MNTKTLNRSVSVIIALVLALSMFCVSTTDVSSAITKPAKVTNLKITKVTKSSCYLKWNKVKNAKGYAIYRKKGSGTYKKVKTTTKTNWTSYKLSSDTKYTYKVKAYKLSKGKKVYGKFSKAKSIHTMLPTVSNFKITNVKVHSCHLEWDKVKHATSYEVFLKSNTESEFTRVAIAKENFIDEQYLTDKSTHIYKVRAVKEQKSKTTPFIYGDFSKEKTIKTPTLATFKASLVSGTTYKSEGATFKVNSVDCNYEPSMDNDIFLDINGTITVKEGSANRPQFSIEVVDMNDVSITTKTITICQEVHNGRTYRFNDSVWLYDLSGGEYTIYVYEATK